MCIPALEEQVKNWYETSLDHGKNIFGENICKILKCFPEKLLKVETSQSE